MDDSDAQTRVDRSSRVAVVQRPLGVPQEVQRVVPLVHPDERPGTIDQSQSVLGPNVIDRSEDRLAVSAVLLVVLQALQGVLMEGAIVNPHDMRELERVGVVFGLLADSGVPIVPDDGAHTVVRSDGLVVGHRVEQVERVTGALDHLKRPLLTSNEARPCGVSSANAVNQKQLSEKVFPSAGNVSGDTYESTH